MDGTDLDLFEIYREVIECLPRRIQGDVLIAIMQYGLDRSITEELKPITRFYFKLIQPQIDTYKMLRAKKKHISRVRSEAAKHMHKKQKKCKMDAKNNFAGCKTDAKKLCENTTNIIPPACACADFTSYLTTTLKEKDLEVVSKVKVDSEKVFEKFYSLFPTESFAKIDRYILETGRYKGGCKKLWNGLETDTDRLKALEYAEHNKEKLHKRQPSFYLLDADWIGDKLNNKDQELVSNLQFKGADLSIIENYFT